MANGWIWTKPFSLPTVGTSGKFDVDIPKAARFMAILNSSGAIVAVSNGTQFTQPQEAIIIQPFIYIGIPIEETQKQTVHWTSTAPLTLAASRGVLMYSNEPITVSGGPMTTGGVAAGVNVLNSVTIGNPLPVGANTIGGVNVVSMPSIPPGANTIGGVNVVSMPSIPPGANHIGEVSLSAVIDSPNMDVPLSTVVTAAAKAPQAATVGFISGSRVAVGTGATVLFNGVVTGRTINIQNFDASEILYLGPATVTNANGGIYVGPNGGVFSLDVIPGSNIIIYGAGSAALTAGISVIN